MRVTLKDFSKNDLPHLAHAFGGAPWHKPSSLFEKYLEEQVHQERFMWVIFADDQIAGYVTLKWRSDYPPFRAQNIPEIMDLNVLLSFRNQGLGSRLLKRAEDTARKKSPRVGLGVGLYADYGRAQQLYVKKRYVPDGRGVTYRYQTVSPGDSFPLDDDLVLWFTKELK